MAEVTIRVRHISIKDLRRMPQEDLAVFTLLGHIGNELGMLSRLVIFAINYPKGQGPQHSFHTSQAMMLVKILGGKTHAGWEFVTKGFFRSSVGRKFGPALTEAAAQARDALGSYFGRKNAIDRLRNEFAFHYLGTAGWSDQIAGAVAAIPDETAEFYDGGIRLNTLWQFPEMVVNHALALGAGEATWEGALDKIIDEVVSVSNHLWTFCDEVMWTIAEEYLGDTLGIEREEKHIYREVPNMRRVRIPVIVDGAKID